MAAKDSFRTVRERLRHPSRALVAALAAAVLVAFVVVVLLASGGGGEKTASRAATPPPPDRPIVRRSFLEQVIPVAGAPLPGAGGSRRIAAAVRSMSLKDKVAQTMLLGFEGSGSSPQMLSLLRRRAIGGIVIRANNYSSKGQITALAAKATPGGLQTWEIARIEAGRPEWGIEIDESTLPQEANLEELHAISYTKGCYTGQETVARVHFRGHVNRHLRGLRAAGPEPPLAGADLLDAAGKSVGDVRSTAASPRLGGIAIGMVRREVELGTSLLARWEGGEMRVDVAHLPFPA